MRAGTEDALWARLFQEFAARGGSLQGRIRTVLVHAILDGYVAPGEPVPSSRRLAEALGVARVTASLALQQLAERGFLDAHTRSGYTVNGAVLAGRAQASPTGSMRDDAIDWARRLRRRPGAQRNIVKPSDWQTQPYPFVYGQFDHALFPKAEWRACVRESLTAKALHAWTPDHIDRDLDFLTEQIQRRYLPSRGIWAARDEILVTLGAQQACFLVADLLMDRRTVVGIEDPGYPDARNNFLLRASRVVPLAVDRDGMVVRRRALARCDYVFVTPSHQCPTGVTMPLERRRALLQAASALDFIVIEDDHESELNYAGKPLPAMKSLDRNGRVIHIGSLSKTMAHGVRIGFIVADAGLIRELRALRRLNLRHPPANNAFAAATFLAQGYRDAFVSKLNAVYRERHAALVAGLAAEMPTAHISEAAGGSAAWIELERPFRVPALLAACAARGVVVEPGDVFYFKQRPATRYLRLGISAIPVERIARGVRELAAAVEDATRARPAAPDRSAPPGARLRPAMP